MRRGSFLSRTAALLLVVLCVAVIVLFAVMPVVRQHRAYDTAIANAKSQLDRFAVARANSATLRKDLSQLKRRGVARGAYLPGKTPALAGADLLRRVKTLVQRSGGSLATSRVLRPDSSEATGGAIEVRVQAQMKGDTKALLQIFHALDTGTPALFLDNVLLTGRTQKKTLTRRGKVKKTWEELVLDMRFDVAGYLWGAGK